MAKGSAGDQGPTRVERLKPYADHILPGLAQAALLMIELPDEPVLDRTRRVRFLTTSPACGGLRLVEEYAEHSMTIKVTDKHCQEQVVSTVQ